MAEPIIRENSVHILAVVNPNGHPPEVGDQNNPSAHLSLDPVTGGLMVTGVAGATANVTVINGPGSPVPVIQNEADTVPQHIVKTVAATGTPEPLAANGTFFKTALIIARKAARVVNTGKVWLGVTAPDGSQPIGMASDSERTINAPEGQRYDLNDFYLDVETAGDGVVVIYS